MKKLEPNPFLDSILGVICSILSLGIIFKQCFNMDMESFISGSYFFTQWGIWPSPPTLLVPSPRPFKAVPPALKNHPVSRVHPLLYAYDGPLLEIKPPSSSATLIFPLLVWFWFVRRQYAVFPTFRWRAPSCRSLGLDSFLPSTFGVGEYLALDSFLPVVWVRWGLESFVWVLSSFVGWHP